MADDLAFPPNVVLHRLLPYTPELQPAEPLWPLAWEGVANKRFDTPVTLTDPLDGGGARYVKWAVGFHWAVALG